MTDSNILDSVKAGSATTRRSCCCSLCLLSVLLVAGCANHPSRLSHRNGEESAEDTFTHQPTVEEMQEVFGPHGVQFDQTTLWLDMNGDGQNERLILLADSRRMGDMSIDIEQLRRGVILDGFMLFAGPETRIPVLYYSPDYGLSLRLDEIDGRTLLVSDGGRDHTQQVWGWWTYTGFWPARWEARWRKYEPELQDYGQWKKMDKVNAWRGK